ncbi:hypothetical protein OF83DRAFT_1029307, partial [Amylostereum chailletii]
PLPGPPPSALNDKIALATLHRYPELFKVVSPINIDNFESLLVTHPNRPFVQSVIRGFREGFRPHADFPDDYPITRDHPERPLAPAELEFAKQQCLEEERLGRFSPPFGRPGEPLLPGMCSVPVSVIPKKSGKLRLIVDHSAGEFSPNSTIDKDDV